MSAALTKGQLPPHQRRLHHRHQHRNHHHRHSHQRHFRRLKVSTGNHPHNHSLPQHHGNNTQGKCRYTSHHPSCRKHHCDNDNKCANDQDEPGNLVEKRPKVNPIFLWALQREQKIIEVRCEDYDKRNRIKLTKTPHGWRSIPRTSSNMYSSCSCYGSNCVPVTKDEFPASSPSISSTSVSGSKLSTSQSTAISLSSCSESVVFSGKLELCSKEGQSDSKKHIGKSRCGTDVMNGSELQRHLRRYYASRNSKCNALENSYRTSQSGFSLSCVDNSQVPGSGDVDYEENGRFRQYDSNHSRNSFAKQKKAMSEASAGAKNSRFDCGNGTFKYIDLETAQKNQSLQPRVILEPLNTFTMRLNSYCERQKSDDDIEEKENSEVENEDEDAELRQATMNEELETVTFSGECAAENEKLTQHLCTKTEDSEYEMDDIEEVDDEDAMKELDEENSMVFEYDDRDSADMMDDNGLEDYNEVLKPIKMYLPIVDNIHNSIQQASTIAVEDDIDEEEGVEENEDTTIDCDPSQLIENNGNIPDLNIIPDNSLVRTKNESTTKNQKVNETSVKRLLPSPPCSVTCSEDASQVDSNRSSTISQCRRLRKAPDLIEVNPTIWRKRGELVPPAHQLRKLIEKSGHSIPDPLLVPRNCLPALAANPGVEIPRLLVTRPELRLPEAVMRPELLADPDILVISLSHFQQVLDAVPEPVKLYIQESVDQYGISNNGAISSYMNSSRKKLSVKPIGSLMPLPTDLSHHSDPDPDVKNSFLHQQCHCSRQESEVTSTARLPDDDSRLWHPLFGCRKQVSRRDGAIYPDVISRSTHGRFLKQRIQNYQQSHQDTNHQHCSSWHRTTLAS